MGQTFQHKYDARSWIDSKLSIPNLVTVGTVLIWQWHLDDATSVLGGENSYGFNHKLFESYA